jgi:hypothetical protein
MLKFTFTSKWFKPGTSTKNSYDDKSSFTSIATLIDSEHYLLKIIFKQIQIIEYLYSNTYTYMKLIIRQLYN